MTKKSCLATFLILWTLLDMGLTFQLQASVQEIGIYGAPGFFLQCAMGNSSNDANNISKVTDIVVLKEDSQNHWIIVAQIDKHGDTIVSDSAVQVKGHVDTVSDSFLKLTWYLAPSSAVGMYKCDVLGFTDDMSPAVYVSPKLIIRSGRTSQTLPSGLKAYGSDLYRALISVKEQLKQSLQSIQLLVDDVKTNVQDSLADIISKQKVMMDKYVNWENSSLSQRKDNSTQQWPEGSYGLPAPDSGCPNYVGSTIWVTGYRTHVTEATPDIPNKVSSSAHMKQPIHPSDDIKLMTQHFCIVENVNGENWPAGSYCIYQKGTKCPNGFDSGFIWWGDVFSSLNTHSGALPASSVSHSSTKINYCCRNDSQSSSPISLPNDKPFYLFRYGPDCQKVAGMWDTQEFMTFRTKEQGTLQTGKHPDDGVFGSGSSITVQLCYYDKNRF